MFFICICRQDRISRGVTMKDHNVLRPSMCHCHLDQRLVGVSAYLDRPASTFYSKGWLTIATRVHSQPRLEVRPGSVTHGALTIHAVPTQPQYGLEISVYIASSVPYFTFQSSRDQAVGPLCGPRDRHSKLVTRKYRLRLCWTH